jgi:hypothetical protein
VVRGLADSSRQGDDERLEGIPDVYLTCTFKYDSASSEVVEPQEADAAMDKPYLDKPCLYSTIHLLVRQSPMRGSPVVPLHLITIPKIFLLLLSAVRLWATRSVVHTPAVANYREELQDLKYREVET